MNNDIANHALGARLDSAGVGIELAESESKESGLGETGRDDARHGHGLLMATIAEDIRGANRPEGSGRFDGSRRNDIRAANRPRIPFDQATATIVEHGRGLVSALFPMSRLRVVGGRMVAGDRELQLEDDGIHRLCRHVGAPAEYVAERLSDAPELRDKLLEFHLRSSGSARRGLNDSNSRVLSRNGVFVDFGRSDLHTLGGVTLLQAIRDGFEDDAQTMEVQDLVIENESFRLDIVSPSVSREVRPGDVIQAGVQVEHSYTGERATSVLAFFVRLICRNGSVYRECVGERRTARTRRLAADRADAEALQVEQVRRLIVNTRHGLAEKLEAMRQLTQERADERQLTQFLRQARMHSRGMVEQLRQSWQAEGGEATAFGLFNALTRLATHGTGVSSRQRRALARLAGVYANRHVHLCPHCFSILRREEAHGEQA